MSLTETRTISDRLTLTLDGLCRAVAARIAGGMLAAAVIVLIWRRVRRVEGRILGLLRRFRAGRLWVVSGPRAGRSGVRRSVGVGRLPRGFGWLLPLVPSEAACFAGQLQAVLAEPEMVALLAASPQAGRVLAPLCRMLGIEMVPVVAVAEAGSEGSKRFFFEKKNQKTFIRLSPPSIQPRPSG
jgi:hypothetical protein